MFDPSEKKFVGTTLDCSAAAAGEENHGPIVGVARTREGVMVTAAQSGLVKLWR